MKWHWIIYYDHLITYREMFERIDDFSNVLSSLGIHKGDIVSVISLGTPETIYLIYAINKIGAIANLMIADIAPQELTENVKQTNSKILFILDKLDKKIGMSSYPIPTYSLNLYKSMTGIKKQLIKLSSKKNKSVKNLDKEFIHPVPCSINYNPESPAVIIYTSGTTGEVKGVLLSNRNINAIARMCFLSGKDYKPREKFLNSIPPFFSFGLGMLHLALYSGMTVVIALIPQIDNLVKMLKKKRPERYVMGPAFSDVILRYSGKDLSFLLDLTGGGGAISLSKERELNRVLKEKNANSKYLNGYGMTELASAVSMNQNNVHKEQSIGIPLPLVNVKVVSLDSREELPYGQEGELLVCSPGLMIEYLNKLAETQETIIVDENGSSWMRTGDIAKIDEDGFIFITGRLKRIYITKDMEGYVYKIYPQRVEDIIDKHEDVNKCAVVAIQDEVRQSAPVVFVVPKQKGCSEKMKEEIRESIKRELPGYYEPLDICILDELPMTSNQKVNYKMLEKKYEER